MKRAPIPTVFALLVSLVVAVGAWPALAAGTPSSASDKRVWVTGGIVRVTAIAPGLVLPLPAAGTVLPAASGTVLPAPSGISPSKRLRFELATGDPMIGDPGSGHVQGTVYYVAPNGDDSHDGQSVTSAWRTIGKAAETLVAGETVYIRGGTYRERVVPLNSGVAGALITYAVYPGEVATIDGSGVTVPEYCGLFDLSGRDYLCVSGLRVIDSAYYGIVAENSSHITIEHDSTYNTYCSGISTWSCDHVVVDGNEVVGACLNELQEHISISNTDTFEVRYNHVHDVLPGTPGKEGICIKDGSRHGNVHGNRVHDLNHVGIYVDAEVDHEFDVAVYQNVVYDIEAMGFSLASERGGLLEDIRLYDNIAYDNLCGLWLSDDGPTHPFKDISIVNNTFAGNGRDGWGVGIGNANADITNVVIRNNICSQNVYSQMGADPGVLSRITLDHNLCDGPRDPEFEMQGASDLVGVSPLFAGVATGDYHLLPGSPAIDAGVALDAPAFDFDGDVRPQDGDGDGVAGFDIGADELTTSAPTIASFLPASGPAGTSVAVTGTGFSLATAVTFNGTPAGFTVTSGTQIAATVPSAATSGPIAVITAVGTATSAASFTVTASPPARPTIARLNPVSGKRKATVAITGSGFGASRGAGFVKFGSKKPYRYLLWTDTRIRCKVPATATYGSLKVTVTTAAGISNGQSFRVKR